MSALTSMPSAVPRTRGPAAEWVLYAIGVAILAYVTFSSLPGVFVPDIKPEVYLNPWARLQLDLSTWLPDPHLGTQNYNLGLAPVDALVGLIQLLGVPPELSVRVLRLSLYVAAGAGARFLFRRIAPDADSTAARVVFVLLYVVNPYSIVAGSTLAILLPYAVFPWLLAALRAALVTRGWRAPATAALLFAAMSGMNVGAVPALQLLAIPALLAWLVWSRQTDLPTALRGLAKTAVLAAGLSLYWLLPAAGAMGTATAVVDNSETLEAIAGPSGWGEVLRGLGLWPMYGGSSEGPWQPGFQPYLSSPLVVTATLLLFTAALLGAAVSRSRARVLGLGLALSVGLLMVGLHPPDSPAPFGSALRWLLENVPGLMVVRTTNKAGAGLALAVSLLIALGVHRLRGAALSPGLKAVPVVALGLVWVLAGTPLWSGQASVGRWTIPGYWREASAALNKPEAGRLWLIPGQVLAGYRWSTDSVDDVTVSLFDQRSTVVRTALPTQNPDTTNLLYHADSQLQSFRLPQTGLSDYARLMGVSQILVRSDVRWSPTNGLSPGLVYAQAERDPGLRLAQTFGAAGENTQEPGQTGTTLESEIPPLAVFDVVEPTVPETGASLARTTVLAGDAAGIAPARTAGLIPDGGAVVYATSLNADQILTLSGAGHRWVLTDSNRRTDVTGAVLQYSTSALLSASSPAPSTRAIGQSWDQTTAVWPQVADVRASKYAFDSHGIAGNPSMAIDGDAKTAWLTGAFGTAAGQWLELDFGRPTRLGSIFITPEPGSDVAIRSFRVSFGDEQKEIIVRPDGNAGTELPGLVGDRLRIEIARTTGTGKGYVGIREIALGPPWQPKGARLPTSLDLLASRAGLSDADLRATAIDVVMTRSTNQEWGGAIEESALYRQFTLPVAKIHRAYGIATAAKGAESQLRPDVRGCLQIATVDGEPLLVRPLDLTALRAGRGWLFSSCGNLPLAAGQHTIAPVPTVVVDTLVLRDAVGDVASEPQGSGASVEVLERSTTSLRLRVAGITTATWVSVGTSLDPGWRATADGQDLGPATTVNGYSMSWQLDTTPESGEVLVTFAPQRRAELARWLSALVLLGTLLLLSLGSATALTPRGAVWRPGRTVVAVSVLAWCWVTQGALGLLVGVVLGSLVYASLLQRATWYRLGVLAAATSPFAWVVGNNALWGSTTGSLVLGNPAPGLLAWLGLTMVTVGVATSVPAARTSVSVDTGRGDADPAPVVRPAAAAGAGRGQPVS